MQKWEMYRLVLNHPDGLTWIVSGTSFGPDGGEGNSEAFKSSGEAFNKFYDEVDRLLNDGWEPFQMNTNTGEDKVLILKRPYKETT